MILSRRVKIQLAIFILLSALGIAYAGFSYVGVRPFNPQYRVTAHFADSGGIFKNAAVSVRGVEAGRVQDLQVVPDGVAVTMAIDPKFHIPADAKAKVVNLSAVGEQFVDIVPQSKGGPYLHDGSVIPLSRTSTPIDDATILQNLYALASSVDKNHLGTVIEELGAAFRDLGPDLQRLIDQGDALTKAAQSALPQTVALINDSKTVLDTQQAIRGDFQTFAKQLATFSQQLVTDDPAIRSVLDNGVTSANQVTQLLQDNRSALPILLGNLVTVNSIQAARLPGLKVMLTLYPASVANGFLASPGDGTGHFGLVATDQAPVCTNGYIPQSEWRNNTLDPKANPEAFGGKANLNTDCREPHDSQINVRGSRNAPRPPGDTTDQPASDTGTASSGSGGSGGAPSLPVPTSGAASAGSGPAVTTYDPVSGLLFGPGGEAYQLGTTGGQRVLGPGSWRWLLLAPAASD